MQRSFARETPGSSRSSARASTAAGHFDWPRSLSWCQASRTTAADFARPKRYAACSCSCRCSQAVLGEHWLISAAAVLFGRVYPYPLPLALLLWQARVQGFQLMLNTELISYVSLIFRYED